MQSDPRPTTHLPTSLSTQSNPYPDKSGPCTLHGVSEPCRVPIYVLFQKTQLCRVCSRTTSEAVCKNLVLCNLEIYSLLSVAMQASLSDSSGIIFGCQNFTTYFGNSCCTVATVAVHARVRQDVNLQCQISKAQHPQALTRRSWTTPTLVTKYLVEGPLDVQDW